MYIVDMQGHILIRYDEWDIRTVPHAERWIKEQGYIIYQISQVNGVCVVTVR